MFEISNKNIFKLILALSILIIPFTFTKKITDSSISRKDKLELIKKEEDKITKILFVGDVMLDRGVSWQVDRMGEEYIFGNLPNIFKDQDLVVANLEGTITNNPSISRINHNILRFTFDPKYSELLKKYNFKVLSLANNHSSDFGNEGYNSTIEYLKAQNMGYFGSSRNNLNLSTEIKLDNTNFCFIGYHDLYTYDESPVIEEIKNIRNKCDHITVFAHWGDEYMKNPNERQKKLAHSFIDSGADLIIGAHPHVSQTHEIYKDKAIFYSLGNFIFDQDFSYDTTHAQIVYVEFGKREIKFRIAPISIDKSKVSIDNTVQDIEFSVPR